MTVVRSPPLHAGVMRSFCRALLRACYVGIVASSVVHALVLATTRTVPNGVVITLHLGILLVATPLMFMTRSIRSRGTWPLVKATSPLWLRSLSMVSFLYFAAWFVHVVGTDKARPKGAGPMPP